MSQIPKITQNDPKITQNAKYWICDCFGLKMGMNKFLGDWKADGGVKITTLIEERNDLKSTKNTDINRFFICANIEENFSLLST
jgi:hypothetical protein